MATPGTALQSTAPQSPRYLLAALALFFTLGGIAIMTIPYLPVVGALVALGGMLPGVAFQDGLIRARPSGKTTTDLLDKVANGLLRVFGALCVVGIVVLGCYAAFVQSEAMAALRGGHPVSVDATMRSCMALGVILSVSLAAATSMARGGALGIATAVLTYWVSFVPLSVATMVVCGGIVPLHG